MSCEMGEEPLPDLLLVLGCRATAVTVEVVNLVGEPAVVGRRLGTPAAPRELVAPRPKVVRCVVINPSAPSPIAAMGLGLIPAAPVTARAEMVNTLTDTDAREVMIVPSLEEVIIDVEYTVDNCADERCPIPPAPAPPAIASSSSSSSEEEELNPDPAIALERVSLSPPSAPPPFIVGFPVGSAPPAPPEVENVVDVEVTYTVDLELEAVLSAPDPVPVDSAPASLMEEEEEPSSEEEDEPRPPRRGEAEVGEGRRVRDMRRVRRRSDSGDEDEGEMRAIL